MTPQLTPIVNTLTRELVELGGPALQRKVDAALRRGGRRVVTKAVRAFQSRAIGRSLFVGAKGRRAARTLIKATRPAALSGGGIRGVEVIAKGLAGIQEHGGPIAPHVIEPKNAPVLAFAGPGGGTQYATRVDHPGGTLPAFPVVEQALAAEESGIRDDIEELVDAHFRDVIGV